MEPKRKFCKKISSNQTQNYTSSSLARFLISKSISRMHTKIPTPPPDISTTKTPPTFATVSSSAPPSSAVSLRKSFHNQDNRMNIAFVERTVQAPPPRFSFHHLIFIDVISPDSCISKTASLKAPRYGESEM